MKKLILLLLFVIISCQKPESKPQEIKSIDVSNTLNLKFGHESIESLELNKYLLKYGYLESQVKGEYQDQLTSKFSFDTEIALKQFQYKYGLEPSGIVDSATYKLINTPRCGVSDSYNFDLEGSRWNITTLRYGFTNYTSDIQESEVRIALKQAFNLWSNQTNLNFEEVPHNQRPDIIIQFKNGDHGDGHPFDGKGNVLAHAYYPPPSGGRFAGDTHFDEAESWAVNLPIPFGATDLITVSAHEIGHSLGLGHSNIFKALMYPYYYGENRNLDQDDINGIQSLYHPSLGIEWVKLPGTAMDIAIHSNNSPYIIGTDARIYKWNLNDWALLPGGGFRISVGSDETPWIVGTDRGIYKWNNDNWKRLPGGAIDIAVGENNNIWIIGTDLKIYKWNGENWDIKPGSAKKITVDNEGIPSIVGTDNRIYIWKNNTWILKNGGAFDIASGHNVTWLVGTDNGIYREVNNRWIRTDGGARSIDVSASGTPWIVGTDSGIYRRK